MVKRLNLSVVMVLLTVIAVIAAVASPQVARAAVGCTATTSSKGYTVTVCLTTPANNAVMSGTSPVRATATIANGTSGLRIAGVIFCLVSTPCNGDNGQDYLLKDYSPAAGGVYEFELDTTLFADRTTTLHAYALMNDGLVSKSSSATVTFQNGQAAPPPVPTGFTVKSGTSPGPGGVVVATVGDSADGRPFAQAVSNMMAGWNPDLFLYLGDVYDKGSPSEFQNFFAQQFGRFDPIANPTVGNHEYSASRTAEGYMRYYRSPPNYYSYDAGGWHFISLDSNSQFDSSVSGVSQTQPGSGATMYNWLAADLTAHASACTIVYYHHPRWNQGEESPATRMSAIWSLLAANDVSLVLNGHDHDYQRFPALDGSGAPAPDGVVQIISGGGGHGTQQVVPGRNPGPNPVVAAAADSAVKLTLKPDRADFETLAPSGTRLDGGSIPCQQGTPDTTPPSAPVLAPPQASTSPTGPAIALSWAAATDDRGVAGYRVRRDGVVVSGDLTSTVTAWTDTSAQPSTTYSYTVEAFDAGGNATSSNAQSVTSPTAGRVVVQAPSSQTADTYVSASSPTAKGLATTMRVSAPASSSGENIAYLAFDVTGTSGIGRATLELYPTSSSGSATASVYGVPVTSWNESTLTWPQRPAIGAMAAAPATPGISAGQWKSWDVTDLVTGNGWVSLAVQQTGSNTTAMSFASKENSSAAFAPRLVIEPPGVADTSAPSVPGGLAAPSVTASSVDLTWNAATDNVGVTGYRVYRNGTLISGPQPVTTTAYTDATVAAGTGYTYTVDAIDAAGNASAPSPGLPVTTPAAADVAAPSVPGGLAAPTVTSSSVDLTWNAATDNVGVTGYRVYRNGTLISGPQPVTTTAYTDATVAAGTGYTYTVDAIDAAGNASAPSPGLPVTTPAPPSAVSTVTLTEGTYVRSGAYADNSYWTSALWRIGGSGQYATHLKVVVSPGSSLPPAAVLELTPETTSAGFEVHRAGCADCWNYRTLTWNNQPPWAPEVLTTSGPVTAGTPMRVDLRPWLTGPGTYSFVLTSPATTVQRYNSLSATTPATITTQPLPAADVAAPSVPGGLTAPTVTSSSVDLTWNAATDNVGVTGYRVHRNGTLISGPQPVTTTAYTDATVAAGTGYTYTVDAIDAAGNASAPSPGLPVTTPAAADVAAPSVPGGLAAPTVTSSSVDLTWNAATDNVGVTGYRVYRNGTLISGPQPVTTTAYTDATVAAGTGYTYTVDAIDAAGNASAPSPGLPVTTPAPPSAVSTVTLAEGTYVRSGAYADNSYWTSALWRIGGSGQYATHLKVVVSPGSSLPPAAVLELTPETTSAGFEVHRAGCADCWNYRTLTWNNQPPWAPEVLTTSGPVTAGTPMRVDLRPWLTGPGTYSFVLTSPATTVQRYNSLSATTPATITTQSQP